MDDWVSADELRAAATEQYGFQFNGTVCARAHAGIIKARAARVVIEAEDGPYALDDVELPPEFWWAKGSGDMEQNWQTGDFSCLYAESGSRWDDHKIHHLKKWSFPYDEMRVAAYDVQFDRQGAALLCPQIALSAEATGQPLSLGDEKRLYDALRRVRDEWTEKAAQLALAGLFPSNSITRDRLRQGLKDAGLGIGRGRPSNSLEKDPAN